ncbi:MAG: ABC transporter ATP-binding protein [Burkholderiaceae bacterium]|jgi:iron complex transport system ATP-binding protein|nr:ABC transporter ATP-binding protein [Burkholderiaceae bacterium]
MWHTSALVLRAGNRILIDRLDWSILPGECWAVLGKNGAGKTTLVRTLASLRQPDSGEISLRGKPLSRYSRMALAKERAYLPQLWQNAFSHSVLHAVLAGRYPYHDGRYWESDTDRQAALSAMQKLGVDALADRDVRTLSGGERQRVALATVFAQSTPLLLLDEPASALDLAHQINLMRLLAAHCRNEGGSVVMVVHDLNLPEGAATHALLLEEGGNWLAGERDAVMTADNLSRCFGQAIRVFQQEGRKLYFPAA